MLVTPKNTEISAVDQDLASVVGPTAHRLRPRRRRRSLEAARKQALNFTAVPPDPERRAPLWHRRVTHTKAVDPLVWLLGAHGGAGVSTLAQVLAPAGDCARSWPAVLEDESPFVVVVAKETIEGLTRAHDLLRQWHCGMAGKRAHLLGLITVAHSPGKIPPVVDRYLQVIEVAAPAVWRVGWRSDWPTTRIADLPVWTPDDEPPAKGPDPHAAVRELGDALISAARTAVYGAAADPEDTP
ncbi:hypothetical protein [Nocardia sp. NPDC127526]|uniref:hypothetical protein n=1 Tax=Nocardia sp. NPDC127526 TaxID=3345393 RepID=UPI00363BEBA5